MQRGSTETSKRRCKMRWLRPGALVLLFALGCALVGCAQHGGVVIPPCPVASEQAVAEMEFVATVAPAVEDYVSEIERYCEAMEELR